MNCDTFAVEALSNTLQKKILWLQKLCKGGKSNYFDTKASVALYQGWPSFLCKAPTFLTTRVGCAMNVGQACPTFSVHAPKIFATQAFIWRCATHTFIACHCSQTCSNIFTLWSQNKAILSGGFQKKKRWTLVSLPFQVKTYTLKSKQRHIWGWSPKKKKGHRRFCCTFTITFGLNMPLNVTPTKWGPFFFIYWRCQLQ